MIKKKLTPQNANIQRFVYNDREYIYQKLINIEIEFTLVNYLEINQTD